MAEAELISGLKLEVCAFFADEFKAALAAEGRDDVEIVPVQGACDERRRSAPAETPPAPSETRALRLMGVCSGVATCPKSPHSCFEFLIGPDKVESLLDGGAHLLTPAMVRAYPETLKCQNEKPENLREYFAESVRAWVVVDAGVTPLTAAEQTAFAAATGGKIELLPTELHLLRANLRATLAQCEADTIVARSAKQIDALQHRLADYTMTYDLIGRLIPHQGEQNIIGEILDLFYMLCAPHAVHLLLTPEEIENGDTAEGAVQLFSQPAGSGKEGVLNAFLRCPAPYGEIEMQQGFYFQIQQDKQTLGVVVVEGIFLPEHRRNYLELALLLMPILRLALHNARSYEKLCATERELRASKLELEQRVVERTAQLTAEIAVRKQNEQALREAKTRLRSSFEAAAIGMALVSIEGRFQDVNQSLCQIVGYSRDELVQKTFQEITHPDDLDVDLNYAKQLMSGERASYQMEKRYFHKDGHIVWILLTGSAVRDAQENLLYFIAQIQDITERKQAEKKLHASNQLLNSIIENIPNMVFLKSASELRFELFNRAGEVLLGHDRNDLLGRIDYDFFPKEQADFFTGKDRATLAQNGVVDIPEEPIETPLGTRILHTKKLALRDEQGRPQYLLGISEDITERKQAEMVLKRHKLVIDTAQDGFWMYDTSGYLLEVNQAYADIMGYTREELIGMHISRLSAQSSTPELVKARIEKIIKQGIASHFETRHCHKDGHLVYFETSNTYLPESNTLFSFLRDITERKLAEDALRESESRYRSLIENSPMCIHEIGKDGRIISMNRAGVLMMGAKDENAVRGRLYLDMASAADRGRIQELFIKAYAGETCHFEFNSKDPREHIFKSCFVPIKNQRGRR